MRRLSTGIAAALARKGSKTLAKAKAQRKYPE